MIIMKKIIALSALISLVLWNSLATANAIETWLKHKLTSTNIKLVHKPFWLFDLGDADYVKNIQLWREIMQDDCVEWSNFSVLDDYGNIISTHKDTKCIEQWSYNNSYNEIYSDPYVDNSWDVSWDVGGFLNDLFWTDEVVVPTYQEPVRETEVNNSESEAFLNNLFWNSLEGTDTYVEPSMTSEPVYTAPAQTVTPTQTTTETSTQSLEDIDALFSDLFGRISDEDLIKEDEKEFTLKGKELFKTIKAYSQAKETITVWWIDATVLEWDDNYNNKIVEILTRVDNEFTIDSIKNDFAKNIWDLSYSVINYKNNDLNSSTRDKFKNEIISNIVTIERKYKILKRKDSIISRSLAKTYSL